ncbi:MAG: hypothetical protein ACD_76C00081G0002 [uncultured bacterium]|nr:MAG: hypothetical protein ACD_76C00081G0002 [uncultured bacterium]HBD05515.1 hypothetical protein [Candidatus Uhrbacteria bacterium]
MEIQAYCVKCKTKAVMKDAQLIEMPAKGGKTRPALKGVCSVCGTGMFKIMSKEDADAYKASQ